MNKVQDSLMPYEEGTRVLIPWFWEAHRGRPNADMFPRIANVGQGRLEVGRNGTFRKIDGKQAIPGKAYHYERHNGVLRLVPGAYKKGEQDG